MKETFATNRSTWDAWTEINYESAFYDVEAFLRGAVPNRARLDALDAELLGDVRGRSLLHLQCHFGLDTLTQARRGATVVGVDFSSAAIRRARALARKTDLADRAEFVEHDVLTLDLERTFDLVYTSWGVLGWLGDLDVWAAVVARHLRPGGRFVLIEGHPFALVFDGGESQHPEQQVLARAPDDPLLLYRPIYSYFPGDPLRLESNQVYSDPAARIDSVTFEWQHSLSEIVGALLAAGLQIELLAEYPFCAWQMFPWMQQSDDGVWVLPPSHPDLPLSFALGASKLAVPDES
jgi:SAM-dependent methyltransferase